MIYRTLSLLLILGAMYLMVHSDLVVGREPGSTTLVLGFLLLAAYCLGYFAERIKLPRITGYILAGLVLGPYFLKFFDAHATAELGFLNSLALSFIAFCAGGELKISHIKEKLKTISFMLMGITLVVFSGVTLAVYSISTLIPFMQDYPPLVRLAISAIFGVISTARSPSSAIAIISETKAKGPFTDTVLAVTVAMDVVVIVFFAIVISLCQVMIVPGSAIGLSFVGYLLLEILVAFVVGFLLGHGIIFLTKKVGVELPVIIGAMGFLVIKFCHSLSSSLFEAYEINVEIEPLLICMAAGFTVVNYSDVGDRFLRSMDRVSLPIYVAFFALTGAAIQVDTLVNGWALGLVVVFTRSAMIFIGSYVSGRAAGDKPILYRNAWLGFITQAGVSLGLLSEMVRRFPEVGVHIQTILIASITFNQIVGPITFKYVLGKVGETRQAGKTVGKNSA